MSTPNLLVIEEIAKVCRMSVDAVRWHRHLRTGVMAKSFRVGRRVVLREDDLNEYLEQQQLRDAS
jgi:hypothetical protein